MCRNRSSASPSRRRTTAELRRQRDAVADADLVELRLDSVSDPDVAGALAGRRRPVIVTCRPTWEGGGFKGSEEERKRILDRGARARRGVRRRRVARALRRSHRPHRRPAHRALVARFRRRAGRSRRARAGDAIDRRRSRQDRRRDRPASATASRCSSSARGAARDGGLVADRHGRRTASRRASSPARFGSTWTYAGCAAATSAR